MEQEGAITGFFVPQYGCIANDRLTPNAGTRYDTPVPGPAFVGTRAPPAPQRHPPPGWLKCSVQHHDAKSTPKPQANRRILDFASMPNHPPATMGVWHDTWLWCCLQLAAPIGLSPYLCPSVEPSPSAAVPIGLPAWRPPSPCVAYPYPLTLPFPW